MRSKWDLVRKHITDELSAPPAPRDGVLTRAQYYRVCSRADPTSGGKQSGSGFLAPYFRGFPTRCAVANINATVSMSLGCTFPGGMRM